MKAEVIQFFQNLPESEVEQFNKAFSLYSKTPGKNTSVERHLNNGGYTKMNLANLLYDLQKLHEITDLEKVPPAAAQISNEVTRRDKMRIAVIGMDFGDSTLVALKLASEFPDVIFIDCSPTLKDFGDQCMEEMLDFAKFYKIPEATFRDEILDLCEQIRDNLAKVNYPAEILEELQKVAFKQRNTSGNSPDPVLNKGSLSADKNELNTPDQDNVDAGDEGENKSPDEGMALRTQYPFLNDPNCPNELKILVADKITHYNHYKEAHARLQEAGQGENGPLSPEEEKKLTEASVHHFEANAAIKEELDFYAAEGKLLGKHAIFAQLALQREVDEMTQDELLKFKEQTPSYISKKNKALGAAASDARKLVLETAIADRNEKLALVNKKLGVS